MSQCMAIASFLVFSSGDVQTEQNCVAAQLNLAIRYQHYFPLSGQQNDIVFHRGGFLVGGQKGALSSRLFLGPVQTGGDVGYIGIDGESIVYRVQMADIRWQPVRSIGVTAGVVEDLWVESGNELWGLRAVEGIGAEYQNWMTRGQLGGSVRYVFPKNLGVAAVSMHTGEGAFRRERNTGKNTAFYLRLTPLQSEQLSMEAYGQEGSDGFLSARNHRLGFRVTSSYLIADQFELRSGASGLQAWGLNGNVVDEPLLVSAWTQIQPNFSGARTIPLAGYVRYDRVQRDSVSEQDIFSGIGYSINEMGTVWLGWNWAQPDETGAAIAGTNIDQHRIHLQFNSQLAFHSIQ